MVIASMIVLGALIIAVRRHPPGMPLAATCSATISAACHPLLGDIVAAVQSVQWGVVDAKDGTGHCFFRSKTVSPPIPGRTYN